MIGMCAQERGKETGLEVRFHYLRPEEWRTRREACPVAYIPLGTLEWHGLHNPMGADGLQAEELALRCAAAGGVAFPTVYYGESRVNSLLETDPKYQEGIARRLGIDKALFDEARFPYSGMEQINHYQQHLVHIMTEAASYGFELAVFIVGHYPLIEHARSAVLSYNQWAYDKKWKRIAGMAVADFQMLGGKYEPAGDHAGGWETSHLLASHPQTVDLSLAAEEMEYGVMSKRRPGESTAAFGEEIYAAAVEEILKRVEDWKSSPEKYMCHGMRLD